MNSGYLSQYFEAIAAKRLTSVEVNGKVSNQHEFNGSKALQSVLGTNDNGDKIYFPTKFLWMGEENETVTAEGVLSWYDSRFGKPRAAEWRLYFPTTDVTELARPGDLLFIAKRTDGSVLSIIVSAGSTVENQLLWLFGVPVQEGKSFVSQDFRDAEDKEVDFAVRFILDELGIEVEEPETDYLDSLLVKYSGVFPTTREFSIFARETLSEINPLDAPDIALMAWMEREEKLFRRLERQIVEQRLRDGFVSSDSDTDVDGFINFSLSVQNRRKSRAGYALENHLEEIFRQHRLRYSRVAETENRSKPDFLFPGAEQYHNSAFEASNLTMLGVKTTCKDRWRQVLSEAARISNKHLFTLEPGISENQTDEMRANNLQLVLPAQIHETYKDNQRSWLMNVQDFIRLTSEKQRRAGVA